MASMVLVTCGMRGANATNSSFAQRFVVVLLATVAALLPLDVRAQTPVPSPPPPVQVRTYEDFDLSTPRRALAAFIGAAREADWEQAAQVLDLHEMPRSEREERGPRLARDLASVIDAAGVDPSAVPDTPESEGERAVVVSRLSGNSQPLVLRRNWVDGKWVWKFAPSTVHRAPELLAQLDRGPIGSRMPASLVETRWGGLEAWQWLGLAAALVVSLPLSILAARVLRVLLPRLVRRSRRETTSAMLARGRAPVRVVLLLAFLGMMLQLLHLPTSAWEVLGRTYLACWVMAVGWLFVRIVDLVAERIAERAASQPGWRARETRTRVMVFRRVMHVLGLIVLVITLLLQFDPVRELGVSLLASAGVVGIVVGLAAQRPLGNLLAGLQLSLTQPLRVGDQVVLEGHFGTVEEIHLSYIVVAVWDERRLVLPMTRLLETPFENWTRAKTDLIGVVLVQVDFSTPFERVRTEVQRFARAHPLCDGRVIEMQVVDTNDRCATIRVLASAHDASAAWNLRCAIREFLITLLQQLDHGTHLPRVRVDEPTPRRTLGIA